MKVKPQSHYWKLAATLYHTIYPQSNFYALSGESSREWVKRAMALEQIFKKEDTNGQ
jgi:hypothetical protein